MYVDVFLMFTHHYFKCKPCITERFDVEEEYVSICLLFVKRPCGTFVSCFNCDISNHRNSHIRMCFQTKRHNRYTNEEHGYNTNNLRTQK